MSKLLIKASLLLAMLATVQAATKCLEIGTCASFASQLTDAAQNKNIPLLCSILTKMIDCLESGISDCQTTGMKLPDSVRENVNGQIKNSKDQMKQVCSGASSGGDGAGTVTTDVEAVTKCADTMKCAAFVQTIAAHADRSVPSNVPIFCSTTKKMIGCFESVISDCQARGVKLQDSAVEKFTTQVNTAKENMKKMCPDASSGGDGAGAVTADDIPLNPTCMDLAKCSSRENQGEINRLMEEMKWIELCPIMKQVTQCQSKSLQDCKKRDMLGDQSSDIESSVNNSLKTIETYCPEKGKTVCTDVSNCAIATDMDKVQTLITDKNFKDACPLIKPMTECFSAALNDCKNAGTPEEQYKVMETGLTTYQDLYDSKCRDGGNINTQTPLLLTMLFALALVAARLA